MSNPNQLFLLADHVKLSLLERQRAQTLNLGDDSQDGHISRSLDQFRDGVEALREEQRRLTDAGDASAAQSIADALPSLEKQYSDLTSQFHGFSSAATTETLTHPNDATLSPDFAHAQSTNPPLNDPLASPPTSTAGAAAASSGGLGVSSGGRKPTLRSASSSSSTTGPKTVRFSDSPAPNGGRTTDPSDPAAQLFGPYRDDPSHDTAGYRDEAAQMDNQQLHAHHSAILRDQDDHLDRLGESIGRHRELSMQIGDELDSHVAMLDDVDDAVDRHQGRLDRAKRSLGRVARSAGECKQMTVILVLIAVLVFLIAVLK